jgi:hypothetical protein
MTAPTTAEEKGIWTLTAVGSLVADVSAIKAAGGSRKVKLPNSTLRIADLDWQEVKDIEGRVMCWQRTIAGVRVLIRNNSPQEEAMSKKTKRPDGSAPAPYPVTLPEPAVEAPKAEGKAAKVPKPVDFPAEKEARAVGQDTKLGALLASLAQGATMEQLVEVLSKSGSPANRGVVRSWLGYDAKRAGYGVRQDGNLFHLVFPEGMTEVAYKPAEKKAPVEESKLQIVKRAAGSAKPKKSKKVAR